MKALRYLAYGLGGAVALVAIALAAALVIVDGGFVKSRLEQAMKEKNRTLRIEGEPKLRLFPAAGIVIGKASLSEAGSDQVFVALDAAEVAVDVMPLLARTAALRTLKVSGLRVNLVRGRNGRMNFADLVEERDAPESGERHERRDPLRLRIGEIAIDRAHLSYRDASSGQELTLGELNLKAGRLDGDAPGPVSFSMRASGRRPEIDLQAHAAGSVRFNLARQEVGLEAFSAQAKGRVDRDTLAIEVAAPKVEITPARATGSAVTGALKLTGPQRNVDARLRVAAVEGTATALSIPGLTLDLNAVASPHAVKGQIRMPVKASLADRVVELPKIAAHLTISSPQIPQRSVTLPIEASARADFGRQNAMLEVATKFDESNVRAKLAAAKLEPLVATLEASVDRLNLDRYLPPPKEASDPNERIDLAMLKGPTLTGKAEIGALTVRRVKLANVKASFRLAGGKLDVSPHSASLYGGSLGGTLLVDANGNRIALKETLQGVQVGPLLRDAAEQDRLEGRGNLDLQITGAGASVAALKKSLAGTARVDLRDGAVKGINLAEALQNVKSVIGAKSAKANDPSKRTDFSEITASFVIRNGVAHNEDLQGKAPLLRLAGAGDVDIGNSTLDYSAKVSLVATSKGQGGRDLSHLAGITVPVKLAGALEKPDVTIDFAEALAKSGGGVARILESAGGAAGGAAGDIGRKLKGLFGR